MKTSLTMIALAVSALVAAGCQCNNPKDNSEQTTVAVQEISSDAGTADGFCGTYEGTLPAADCAGIRTTLVLNEDTTYDLTSVYLTEEPQEFKTSGVYEREGEQLIVLITPSSGEKTYYRILENSVALVNADGQMAEGETAELYVLKKK